MSSPSDEGAPSPAHHREDDRASRGWLIPSVVPSIRRAYAAATAASSPLPPPLYSDDVLSLVASFADGGTLLRMGMVCTTWRDVTRRERLWQRLLLVEFGMRVDELRMACRAGGVGESSARDVYRGLARARHETMRQAAVQEAARQMWARGIPASAFNLALRGMLAPLHWLRAR
jgi:hypothetical protein